MFYFSIIVMLASISFGALHLTNKGNEKKLKKINISFSILMVVFALANLLQILT